MLQPKMVQTGHTVPPVDVSGQKTLFVACYTAYASNIKNTNQVGNGGEAEGRKEEIKEQTGNYRSYYQKLKATNVIVKLGMQIIETV